MTIENLVTEQIQAGNIFSARIKSGELGLFAKGAALKILANANVRTTQEGINLLGVPKAEVSVDAMALKAALGEKGDEIFMSFAPRAAAITPALTVYQIRSSQRFHTAKSTNGLPPIGG